MKANKMDKFGRPIKPKPSNIEKVLVDTSYQ